MPSNKPLQFWLLFGGACIPGLNLLMIQDAIKDADERNATIVAGLAFVMCGARFCPASRLKAALVVPAGMLLVALLVYMAWSRQAHWPLWTIVIVALIGGLLSTVLLLKRIGQFRAI